jgi:hypothetical protein
VLSCHAVQVQAASSHTNATHCNYKATLVRYYCVPTSTHFKSLYPHPTSPILHVIRKTFYSPTHIHSHTHSPPDPFSSLLPPTHTPALSCPVSQSVSQSCESCHSVSPFSDATVSPVKQSWSATRLDLTALDLTD